MSRHSDVLSRAITDLEQTLKTIDHGTRDQHRHIKRIDLARDHIDQWQEIYPPPNSFPRGGSSSPSEVEDRTEEQRIRERIHTDERRLTQLVRSIEHDTHELYLLSLRYTETLHPAKLPSNEAVPGCRSCARTTKRLGGHFAPVRPDVKGHGLCDWCYRHALAEAKGAPITAAHWPPIEACDRYHREGAQAAGRWLAEQQRSGRDARRRAR